VSKYWELLEAKKGRGEVVVDGVVLREAVVRRPRLMAHQRRELLREQVLETVAAEDQFHT
jgi:hypothetical protein